MSRITHFQLPDGSTVLVEAAEKPPVAGESRAALETIGKYLNAPAEPAKPPELADRIGPIIKALKVIQETIVAIGPDSMELEAGIKFTGEAGIILSKYGAEASISVKLAWNKSHNTPADKASESNESL
ncbi:MAG: hypothetical protein JO340_03975 [Acidobacteriaceae bacterium]|nr:hypothetical protein [Acidobacteriaceae bacterium]